MAKFLDEAKIYLRSGDGGAGCDSFRREKYVPNGGPDGGNGGRGGHVIFTTSNNINTLIDFRYKQHFKADRGQHGMGRNRYGARGEDLVISVPIGTEIIDEQSGQVLQDMSQPDHTWQFLQGGKGGRGNAMFATSTNQAPRNADDGMPGEEAWVRLRLKLLADVGLLGLPNAGKSTFLSTVSNARPEVADYPFTTINPQLGMVRRHGQDMVLADLPGLIEGASEGRGRGHRFLKHLSRCAVILHLIDGTAPNPVEAYHTIQGELVDYDKTFASNLQSLPQIVALSKADAMLDAEKSQALKSLEEASGVKPRLLSSASSDGVDDLLDGLLVYVQQARQEQEPITEEDESQLI